MGQENGQPTSAAERYAAFVLNKIGESIVALTRDGLFTMDEITEGHRLVIKKLEEGIQVTDAVARGDVDEALRLMAEAGKPVDPQMEAEMRRIMDDHAEGHHDHDDNDTAEVPATHLGTAGYL